MKSASISPFPGSTADLYTYFYKRGLELTKKAGTLCYISPNKFFRAGYGANLRQELSSRYALRQIIDFGELPVFAAGTDPTILLVANSSSHQPVMSAIIKEKEEIQHLHSAVKEKGFLLLQEVLSHEGWTLERPEVLSLLKKLKASGIPLEEYVQGRLYRGILTGFNEAFIIDSAKRNHLVAEDPQSAEIIKPWLRGKDIKRWYADWQELYIINIQSSANREWAWSKAETEAEAEQIFMLAYPAIYNHIIQWKAQLKKREDQGSFIGNYAHALITRLLKFQS